MPKILVVDDNSDILDALDLLLHLHQYDVITANNAKDALFAMHHQAIDLVIQDMNFTAEVTSGEEGKSLFYQIKQLAPHTPIILMTAWTQLETAVELVKAGAADYLPKPWDDVKLLEIVSTHCDKAKPAHKKVTQSSLLYQSPVMVTLMSQANRVAQSDVNVLITGPNGSGKEKLADHLHQHSVRAGGKFLKVNIGALPEDLMEAELFGAEKGAFTGANSQRVGRFEEADGGTLFLDEIGNLSLAGQAKLLRVLQTGEFERLGSNTTLTADVRVICATNANLVQMVQEGSFREDLWFRLNVIELSLPALKARPEDIVLLADKFLGNEYSLSRDAVITLQQHDWPGNVRELENACLRATVFASDKVIQASDFALATSTQSEPKDDKQLIVETLEKHNWVIKKAAESLGLTRQSLYRRMEKYQISTPS